MNVHIHPHTSQFRNSRHVIPFIAHPPPPHTHPNTHTQSHTHKNGVWHSMWLRAQFARPHIITHNTTEFLGTRCKQKFCARITFIRTVELSFSLLTIFTATFFRVTQCIPALTRPVRRKGSDHGSHPFLAHPSPPPPPPPPQLSNSSPSTI